MMNSVRALEHLLKGDSVRHFQWYTGHYVYLKDGSLVDEDGDYATLSINGASLQDGWEVIAQPHDWSWALEQLKDGKAVRRRCWWTVGNSYELHLVDDSLCDNIDDEGVILSIDDFTATDWELAE